MGWITTLALFLLTAVAEIAGCYQVLPWATRAVHPWVLAGTVLPVTRSPTAARQTATRH